MRKSIKYFVVFSVVAVFLALSGCLPQKNESPTVSLTVPRQVDSGATFTINFTATDPEGEELSYTVYMDTTEVATGTVESGKEKIVELTAPEVEKDTTISVKVEVKDSAGNVASDQQVITVKAPEVTNETPELEISLDKSELELSDLEPTGTVLLTIKATDDQDSLNYSVSLNGAIIESGVLSSKAFSFEKTVSIVLDKDNNAGINTITVEVWDSFNAKSIKSAQVTVKVPGNLMIINEDAPYEVIGCANSSLNFKVKYLKSGDITINPATLTVEITDRDGVKVYEQSWAYENLDQITDEFAIKNLAVDSELIGGATKAGLYTISAKLEDYSGKVITTAESGFYYYKCVEGISLSAELSSDNVKNGYMDGGKPATLTVIISGASEVLLDKEGFSYDIENILTANTEDLSWPKAWEDLGDYYWAELPITLTVLFDPLTDKATEVAADSTATWILADGYKLIDTDIVKIDNMGPRLIVEDLSADGRENYRIKFKIEDANNSTDTVLKVWVDGAEFGDPITQIATFNLGFVEDGSEFTIDQDATVLVDRGRLKISFSGKDELGHVTDKGPDDFGFSEYLDNKFGAWWKELGEGAILDSKAAPFENWAFDNNRVDYIFNLHDNSGVDESIHYVAGYFYNENGDPISFDSFINDLGITGAIGAGQDSSMTFYLRFDDNKEYYIPAGENLITVYDKVGNSTDVQVFDKDLVYDDLAPRITAVSTSCKGAFSFTVKDYTLQYLDVIIDTGTKKIKSYDLTDTLTATLNSVAPGKTYSFDLGDSDDYFYTSDYKGVVTLTILATDMLYHSSSAETAWTVYTKPITEEIKVTGQNKIDFDHDSAVFTADVDPDARLWTVKVYVPDEYKNLLDISLEVNGTTQNIGDADYQGGAWVFGVDSVADYGDDATLTVKFAPGVTVDASFNIRVEFYGKDRCMVESYEDAEKVYENYVDYYDLFPAQSKIAPVDVIDNNSASDVLLISTVPGTPEVVDATVNGLKLTVSGSDVYNADYPDDLYWTLGFDSNEDVFNVTPIGKVWTERATDLTFAKGDFVWKVWGVNFVNIDPISFSNVEVIDSFDYVKDIMEVQVLGTTDNKWVLYDPAEGTLNGTITAVLNSKPGVEWILESYDSAFGWSTNTAYDMLSNFVQDPINAYDNIAYAGFYVTFDTGMTFDSSYYDETDLTTEIATFNVMTYNDADLNASDEATGNLVISANALMDHFGYTVSVASALGCPTTDGSAVQATLVINLNSLVEDLYNEATIISLSASVGGTDIGSFSPSDITISVSTTTGVITVFVDAASVTCSSSYSEDSTITIAKDGMSVKYKPTGFNNGFGVTNFESEITGP